ncbi:MAG TPA: 2-amino-4-hydroxy-6-hydroxymethyldihydropteridine diphosphokinase [Sphingobacteriaceae bacterium]
MQDVYLLLGSNLGDRLGKVEAAAKLIEKFIGPIVLKSGLYETASWGNTDQPDFINQVLLVQTAMPAREVLEKALAIEVQLGRVRHEKWGSRMIDIDILFYGDSVIEEADLKVPHPHLHERAFVLIPLKEIAPELLHPVFRQTVSVLARNLEDSLLVKRI